VPLTVHGNGFASLANHSAHCGFGYAPADPDGPWGLPFDDKPDVASGVAPLLPPRPRFHSAATYLSPTTMRCEAPPAGYTHAPAAQLRLELGATSSGTSRSWTAPPLQRASLRLLGAAVVQRGALVLTTAQRPGMSETGAAITRTTPPLGRLDLGVAHALVPSRPRPLIPAPA